MGILSKYLQPTDQVRTRDVIREIPGAVGKVAKGIGGFVGGLAKSAVEDVLIEPTVRTGVRDRCQQSEQTAARLLALSRGCGAALRGCGP